MIKIAKTDIKKAFLGLFGSICTLDDFHVARMYAYVPIFQSTLFNRL